MDIRTLKTFQKRLSDLTSRNRSLMLLKLPQEQFLDIASLDFLDNHPAHSYLENLISGKVRQPLCAVLDARHEATNAAAKQLGKVARKAAFLKEEHGNEDLHLGWPIVQGKFSDGTPVRGPLLFWPVALETAPNKGKATWFLLRRDTPLVVNRALLLAYGHYNGIKISEELLETDFEDFSKEPLIFRTEVFNWLKTNDIAINITSDIIPEHPLVPFVSLTKNNLESTEKQGELHCVSTAILGIFPQAKSYLVRDYDQLIAQLDTSPPFQENQENPLRIREADCLTPFRLDASQEAAFLRVKAGESIVVQGPPGTGKSELIANLVADFAARGKKVLVVSQKNAALETIASRLKREKMEHFVGNLHDFRQDRAVVYQQLTHQIDQAEIYRRENQGLDAILLERGFSRAAHVIDQATAELNTLREALFDASVCGLSPKELYLTTTSKQPEINLGENHKRFKYNELDPFLRKITKYEAYHKKLSGTFWERRHPRVASLSDATALADVLRAIPETTRNILQKIFEQIGQRLTWTEVLALPIKTNSVSALGWQYLKTSETEQKVLPKIIEEALEIAEKGLVDVQSPDLWLGRATEALEARKSFVKWLFFGGKQTLHQQAKANGLPDLDSFHAHLTRRIAWEQTLQKLPPRWQLPDGLSEKKAYLGQLKNAFAEARANIFSQEESVILVRSDSYSGFLAAHALWQATLTDAHTHDARWQEYLTVSQIATAQEKEVSLVFLQDNFEIIREAEVLWADFHSIEKEIIQQLTEANASDFSRAFQHALGMAWLAHLETVNPVLRGVSGLTVSQLEESLQEAIQQKQALAGELVRLRLKEKVYEDIALNRLNNQITYKDLRHQTQKKRQIWPIRRLLGEFSEEIFRLVPVWLASPETVSAVFTLSDAPLFDLVIFDEASQCFAEQGLPAMWRGRQVVIAGDSQQLQPSDLYRVHFDETEDDLPPELEVTSLLELAARDLPEVYLRGHYRSKSLELIAFSNEHFYKNYLQLLPDYQVINKKESAIFYQKVAGNWNNRTNQAEAKAVLDLVEKLYRDSPEKSIGIVTFNDPQRDCIQETLARLPASKTPEPLFIKNLENVQGDERDIIIFSVGYAPDASGKINTQFGDLNKAGGENRLNVAITRARERVYVIASFAASQLQVDDAKNLGPKLLKSYLAFVEDVSANGYQPRPMPTDASGWLLKDQLRKDDPTLEDTLPFADLVRMRYGAYETLYLTDDDAYRQASSAKEAHGYLPLLLKAKNWTFERRWSREFYRLRYKLRSE